MKSTQNQLKAFIIVGLITVFFDYLILYLLTELAKISYLVSSGVGFILASILNYWLSVKFVFERGRFNNVMEFSVFLFFTLMGLSLNQALMFTLVDILIMHYIIAKAISLIVVTTFNFLSKKFIVFKN